MSAPVLIEISEGIARLRFNRPDSMNVIDVEMAEGFAAAVDRALADPSVRVILISAEGRAFVAGGDLASFRRAENKSVAARAIIVPMHAALERLATAPQIALCAAQGAVAGAGVSILAFADLAIVADDATFNLAYGRVAVSPDCGASWSLPRIIGQRRALELALLCETIDADEALRLGLVNRVVPRVALEEEAEELAQKLAVGAPIAMARTKALMRASFSATPDEQLDAELASFTACTGTEDFTEALEAFFGKRRPIFTGR